MSDEKDFEIGGVELTKDEFKAIESKFRDEFFIVGEKINWKGSKRPSWCQILENKTIEELEGKIQNHIPFFNEFYVYFEFKRKIYRCSHVELVHYFESLPEWIENDLYIFTSKMDWCLVSTHDSEILLVK